MTIRILTKMLVQRAVYWHPTGTDRFGQPTFADPVELAVRWEERRQLFINDEGVEQVSRAIVYVESDVAVRGYLKLGTLLDLSDNAPLSNDAVFRILVFNKIPTLKGDQFLREAML